MIGAATPLEDLTEKAWQSQLVKLARTVGFTAIYHTHLSKRSQPGFPDLVLLRERVVFIEVKTEKGKLSPSQKEWQAALLAAGAETYVVRPRDLDAIGKVLAYRGRGWYPESTELLEGLREEIA